MLEVAVEVSLASGSITSLHYNNPAVKTILEGLLAHFFSAGRPSYHREDILWFLKFANEQEQWRVSPFLEDSNQLLVEMSTGIVSGKLEEDLVSKLETTHTEVGDKVVCLLLTEVGDKVVYPLLSEVGAEVGDKVVYPLLSEVGGKVGYIIF